MTIPRVFSGGNDPEDFLSWAESTDNFIHHNQVSTWETLRLAISLLRGEAKAWWNAEEEVRWYEEEPILTWEELKVTMSFKHVPNFQWEETEFDFNLEESNLTHQPQEDYFSTVSAEPEEETKAVSVLINDQNVVKEAEFIGTEAVHKKEHTTIKSAGNHICSFDKIQPAVWINCSILELLKHGKGLQNFVFEPGKGECEHVSKVYNLIKGAIQVGQNMVGSFILRESDLRANLFKGGGNDAILSSSFLKIENPTNAFRMHKLDQNEFNSQEPRGGHHGQSNAYGEHFGAAKISMVHDVSRDGRKTHFLGYIGLWKPPDGLMKFLFFLGEPMHSSNRPKLRKCAKTSKEPQHHVLEQLAQGELISAHKGDNNISFESNFDQAFVKCFSSPFASRNIKKEPAKGFGRDQSKRHSKH